MSRLRALSIGAGVLVLSAAAQAAVTTSDTSFTSFFTGSVNGQGGWAVSNASFDQEVVDLGGNKVLRLSNKVTSGSFGDMPFAPRPGGTGMTPGDPVNGNPQFFAGESSTGANYDQFIGSFDFRTVDNSHDPGARITISPDNGQGGRQGFIALESTAAGMTVSTFDVDDGTGNFVGPQLLATLGFAAWHNLTYVITFNDGPSDDVAEIYIDNLLVTTINSWERFYAVNQPLLHPNGVPVQTLLFRLSGTAALDAHGFYIDNVKVALDNTGVVPIPGTLALAALGLLALGRRRSKSAA